MKNHAAVAFEVSRALLVSFALTASACSGEGPPVHPGPRVAASPPSVSPSAPAEDASGAQPEVALAEPAPPATAPPTPVAPPPADPWRAADGAPTPAARRLLAFFADAPNHGLGAPLAAPAAGQAPPSGETLEAALRRHAAALAPRPREHAYLVDEEHGFYHSPDEEWLKAPPPLSEAAAGKVEATLAAGREGRLADLDAALDALLPPHPAYRALVDAARRYAALCAKGGWAPIELPRSGRVTSTVKDAVAERLAVEGFVVDNEDLHASVRRWREAHQLPKIRRFIDAELVDALNVRCEDRLETLRLNVRRWRHSAVDPHASAHVFVNLASQELAFIVDGAPTLASRVVVGNSRPFFSERLGRLIRRNSTPILADSIVKIIVNPDWKVPARIAREEIEPALAEDPEYLEKHHFKAIPTAGGRMFVQSPGDHNALGRMKILFPNEEGIYLHDTPHKGKFQLPVRAASHGCMRVEKILELGMALVTHDRAKQPEPGRPLDRWILKHHLERMKTWAFPLETPIPVYAEYYTASVAEVDGLEVVRFHPDIYGYDAEAVELVAARDRGEPTPNP